MYHDGSLSLHTRSLKYGKVRLLLPKLFVASHKQRMFIHHLTTHACTYTHTHTCMHTRTHTQLSQGTLVTVPPALVKQCKNHFHNMLCGASIILGNNGYVWISTKVSDDHQQPQMRFQTPVTERKSVEEEVIKMEEREIIARLRNCILALAQQRILLYDTTVQYTYEASLKYQVRRMDVP